jgi:hypothetical protein
MYISDNYDRNVIESLCDSDVHTDLLFILETMREYL